MPTMIAVEGDTVLGKICYPEDTSDDVHPKLREQAGKKAINRDLVRIYEMPDGWTCDNKSIDDIMSSGRLIGT